MSSKIYGKRDDFDFDIVNFPFFWMGTFPVLSLMVFTFLNLFDLLGFLVMFVCVCVGGGGRVVRWSWVNFKCPGVLLIWIRVGQGPAALAVGAGGGLFGHFFSRLSIPVSLSLSLGDGPI